jgi:four helix bundle protein
MIRDHRKLRVFQQADGLALAAYAVTRSMPSEERFGLQAQIRRAAISVAANIVEGCARPTTAEYRRFLEIAHASSREIGFLIDIGARLKLLDSARSSQIVKDYEGLATGLVSLVTSVKRMEGRDKA